MADLDGTTFLTGANAGFIAELYTRFLEHPDAVDESWRRFFSEMGDEASAAVAELRGPIWAKPPPRIIGNSAVGAPEIDEAVLRRAAADSIRALNLIRAYRVRGHLEADLDPLGLEKRGPYPELDYQSYGFTEADFDCEIFINSLFGRERATLREIVALLRATYCDKIGVEYMHIQVPIERAWIQQKFEKQNRRALSAAVKKEILQILTAAETFERFLDRRYTGTKRFGIEGAESLMPALEAILYRGSELGIREFVIGMPHRGRLNVLANFVGKPFAAIFSEFQGNATQLEHVHGSGDVKYHLGTSGDREVGGRAVHLSLAANPSHLEAVDPVVLGKVRAKQHQRRDSERTRVASILMHGDAAFAGQGLVAEALELSELAGFSTGGTIHVIVNNQIGFTTSPSAARSSPYPSDMAKGVQAPIFHVDGDDPEAVVEAARIATEYRQQFKKDVVVDLFCYRRHGHNEADEPAFTQPLMYRAIDQHPTTRQIYASRLVAAGVVDEAEVGAMATRFVAGLEEQFEAAKSYRPNKADWLEGAWAGLHEASDDDRRGDTGVATESLREFGHGLVTVPDGFHLNPKIARQLEAKLAAIEAGEGIDWATAEALAIASLCAEGTHVRMSGQDSGRGTFSQRHAVLFDQETEEQYVPINHVRAGQGLFEIIDSPLSEAGVVGFEYGYSLADPSSLVLWEAQFGDFANGAQVIIDQFLSAGEAKWLRMSGLVLLLPHGYEGQGPEHSSARLERYLQLCAEDNIQVCNLTSAANYFHALRRQIRRNFRKPLVVFTPKSLLRAKEVMSRLDEMGSGSSFHRIVAEGDRIAAEDQVRRVVLCSGKVYFDLDKARAATGDDRRCTRPRRAALPVPVRRPRQGVAALPQCRDRLVPGRAAEYGCVELCRPAHRRGARRARHRRQAPALCRPRRGRFPGYRALPATRRRADATRRRWASRVSRADGDRGQSPEPR